jgi:hypothetical protein
MDKETLPFWQYVMFCNVLIQEPNEPANIIATTHFPEHRERYNPYEPCPSCLRQIERSLDLIDSEHRSF